jgi:hypothetical protein
METKKQFERKWALDGITYHIPSGCGTCHITVNFQDNKPVEIYAKSSAKGGCKANMEAIGRIMSIALQDGVSIDRLLEQCDTIRCPTAMAAKDKTVFNVLGDSKKYFVLSCPHAVGMAIKMAIIDKSKSQDILSK